MLAVRPVSDKLGAAAAEEVDEQPIWVKGPALETAEKARTWLAGTPVTVMMAAVAPVPVAAVVNEYHTSSGLTATPQSAGAVPGLA